MQLKHPLRNMHQFWMRCEWTWVCALEESSLSLVLQWNQKEILKQFEAAPLSGNTDSILAREVECPRSRWRSLQEALNITEQLCDIKNAFSKNSSKSLRGVIAKLQIPAWKQPRAIVWALSQLRVVNSKRQTAKIFKMERSVNGEHPRPW